MSAARVSLSVIRALEVPTIIPPMNDAMGWLKARGADVSAFDRMEYSDGHTASTIADGFVEFFRLNIPIDGYTYTMSYGGQSVDISF